MFTNINKPISTVGYWFLNEIKVKLRMKDSIYYFRDYYGIGTLLETIRSNETIFIRIVIYTVHYTFVLI
ncbi:MAG: hypothetical protein O6940_02525, partial [Ignavibacteria bacterium]|nr:hypothetical protein [Ignavibacteria bacterium]